MRTAKIVPPVPPAPVLPVAKPTVAVTVEPSGDRAAVPRSHTVTVMIPIGALGPRYADMGKLADTVRHALTPFLPAGGRPEGIEARVVSASRRSAKNESKSVAIGVEGTLTASARPSDEAVELLRTGLVAEGYRLALREKRECAEAGCIEHSVVEWNRASTVPAGWFSHTVCGRHSYRSCNKCKSVYVFTSTNAAGQAPSVHCKVCGAVMIEWGSSKVWNAALVARGPE